MDIKESGEEVKKELKPIDPIIRTMANDLAVLSDKKPITSGKQKEALPPESLPIAEQKKKPLTDSKKRSFSKLVLVSLIFLLVIGGIGGFFYWWNYLRVIPVPETYSKCENNQCVVIEGQGENQCSTDQDCQPIEPILPESIIPVDKTETITFNSQEKDKFLNQLKVIVGQKQATSTLDRVLIKKVSTQKREYLSLSDLLSVLELGFPENILRTIAVDETQADNYTLFFSRQTQGNRLGLVLNLKQEADLSENLKIWESTIKDDLKLLFLGQQTPSTTIGFQDNAYRNIAIRYMNFPAPDLSVDYAIVTNKLIIATSRESMYTAIDALLGE